jgi:hypothetical protein
VTCACTPPKKYCCPSGVRMNSIPMLPPDPPHSNRPPLNAWRSGRRAARRRRNSSRSMKESVGAAGAMRPGSTRGGGYARERAGRGLRWVEARW